MGSAALHRSFVVVDVESYGDPTRTSPHRTAVRDGMYQVLMTAFRDCGLPWDDKAVDDAGDCLMVLVPADVPKSVLVERLPERVASALRRHNHVHSDGARLRMRMAVHAGEVHYDDRGRTGDEMIFTYRILDASAAKQALKNSTATLVLIASDPFYQAVIRHEPAARPESFRLVDVDVKEVRARAWIRLVDDDQPPVSLSAPLSPEVIRPAGEPMPLAALTEFVAVLLRTPGFETREARDLVLQELPFAPSLKRLGTDRADTISVVRGCEHYPGGLESLVEAIRLHAEGSTAMAELDTLMAARQAPC